MPNTCIVIGCKNGLPGQANQQTFEMPTSEVLRRKWKRHLNRTPYFKYLKSHRVCVVHFTEDSFEGPKDNKGRTRIKKKLKDNAFPTLFMNGPVPVPVQTVTLYNGLDHCYFSRAFADGQEEPGQSEPVPLDVQEEIIPQEAMSVGEPEPSVLQNIIEQQEDKISQLEELQDLQVIVTKDLEAKVQALESEVNSLKAEKEQNEQLLSEIRQILNPDQLKAISKKSRYVHWTDLTLQQAMKTLFTCHGTGYRHLRKEMKLPLPSISTIQRHLSKVELKPGIAHHLLDLSEMKIRQMPESERYVILIFDECGIKAQIEMDPVTGSIVGKPTLSPGKNLSLTRRINNREHEELAFHAFNALAHGLSSSFDLIVGHHFTDRSFDVDEAYEWVKECIDAVQSRGLIVKAIVTDQATLMEKV